MPTYLQKERNCHKCWKCIHSRDDKEKYPFLCKQICHLLTHHWQGSNDGNYSLSKPSIINAEERKIPHDITFKFRKSMFELKHCPTVFDEIVWKICTTNNEIRKCQMKNHNDDWGSNLMDFSPEVVNLLLLWKLWNYHF